MQCISTYTERKLRSYYVWGGLVYQSTMGKQSEATTFKVKVIT